MATRRVLICGHTQRLTSAKWRRLNLTSLFCSRCKAERAIAGPVPRKAAPEPVGAE